MSSFTNLLLVGLLSVRPASKNSCQREPEVVLAKHSKFLNTDIGGGHEIAERTSYNHYQLLQTKFDHIPLLFAEHT